MEYFKLINVEKTLLAYMTDIVNWRSYSYCSFVLDKDSYLGKIDHFPDSGETLKYLRTISNSSPVHLPQNKLCKILFENIGKQDNYTLYNKLLFNTNYINYSVSSDNKIILYSFVNVERL